MEKLAKGELKIVIQPGEFMSKSGHKVKPNKVLDKELYRDIVLEEQNRILRLQLEHRKRQLQGEKEGGGEGGVKKLKHRNIEKENQIIL